MLLDTIQQFLLQLYLKWYVQYFAQVWRHIVHNTNNIIFAILMLD